MEKVGIQTKLSIRQAFKIAMQGIRIRLGRAIVTISGVTLGTAFLMSSVTSQIVIHSVAKEREIKQQVELMENALKNEIGSLNEKMLAVTVCGNVSKAEEFFLKRLIKKVNPSNLKVIGASAMFKNVSDDALKQEFAAIIVIGDNKSVPPEFKTFAKGISPTTVLIDSDGDRNYAGVIPENIKKEAFFSAATEQEKEKAFQKEQQNRFRTIWIAIISVLVTVISVSNALLMSVTERFKEIGTMKCLGALSSFIRQLFLIESAVIGIAGSVVGTLLGAAFSMIVFAFSFSFSAVFGSVNYSLLLICGIAAIVIGTLLSILAAIYPANVAAKMVPATALRTNV